MNPVAALRPIATLVVCGAIGALGLSMAAGEPIGAREPVLVPVAAPAGPAILPALPSWVGETAHPSAPLGAWPSRRSAERHQQVVDLPIDGFEAAGWPDRSRWPLVADLEAIARGDQSGGAPWATSDCTATEGTRALRAADAGRACDAGYPAGAASSALLSLDLSQTGSARALALVFDVWMDADFDEGLLLHYVRFDEQGETAERHLVWSGTGRLGDWVRGVSIDLTNLRDRYDPAWSGDLRGQRVYLEFLFRSGDGSVARGALIDRLRLQIEMAPPTPVPSATARPTATVPPTATAIPSDLVRTNACSASSDCVQLAVRAFVDHRCDGRLQPGVDTPLRADPAPRVDVVAGAELLGAPLSAAGTVTFLFPSVPSAEVTLALPDGYEVCPGVANPASVPAEAFRRGLARLDFRVRRQ